MKLKIFKLKKYLYQLISVDSIQFSLHVKQPWTQGYRQSYLLAYFKQVRMTRRQLHSYFLSKMDLADLDGFSSIIVKYCANQNAGDGHAYQGKHTIHKSVLINSVRGRRGPCGYQFH